MYNATVQEIFEKTAPVINKRRELLKRSDALIWDLEELNLKKDDAGIPYSRRFIPLRIRIDIKNLAQECGFECRLPLKISSGLARLFQCQEIIFGNEITEEDKEIYDE